jgi:hypothetical protein
VDIGTPAAAAGPFRTEEILTGATLERFRAIVESAARPDFDSGVAALVGSDFATAEQSFKNAQRASAPLGNSTAPLALLGATYAASGHVLEATNVWQAALIGGSEYPELYEWLARAQLHLRNLDQAAAVLGEAMRKWPADPRFAPLLADLQRLQIR